MKRLKFFRVLTVLALAFSILFTAVPSQASWVDQLWDAYSRMSGGSDSDDDSSDAWEDTGDPDSLLDVEVEEDGEYTSKWEVAAYIHEFGDLPDNYITKKQAEKLGWDSSEGNLDEAAPGKSIGGDRFGNYEGSLPEKKGRDYYECDIDYEGGYRGSERIIYSDDGLIFYTEDHYETFEQLWPEE